MIQWGYAKENLLGFYRRRKGRVTEATVLCRIRITPLWWYGFCELRIGYLSIFGLTGSVISLKPMTAMQLVPDSHLLRSPIAGVGRGCVKTIRRSSFLG